MGADEVPTRSQGQTATEAVAGSPSISSPILTHTQQIYLIGPSGSTAQARGLKIAAAVGGGGGGGLL